MTNVNTSKSKYKDYSGKVMSVNGLQSTAPKSLWMRRIFENTSEDVKKHGIEHVEEVPSRDYMIDYGAGPFADLAGESTAP